MEELWQDHNIFYNVLCFLITENEKLFDRSDARLYWKTVFHISVTFHHLYTSVFAMGLDLTTVDSLEIQTLRRFRPAYLTGWNFLFQTMFLLLAVGHDALEWVGRHESHLGRLVRYWRDVVFSGLVLPMTVFVALMFWTVYAIDRELVFPRVYDEIVPWWFNHCVHTNILVIVCLETALQPRRRPVDSKMEHIFVITVLVAYAVVYYSIYFISHRWLYQVFGILNWWQVCLYQCGIWASSYCFYRLQYPVNRLIHGSSDDEELEAKSQNNGQVIHSTDVAQDMVDGNRNTNTNGGVVANGNGVAGVTEDGDKAEANKEVIYKNGTLERKNSLKKPPFADRSWSLKYRTLRSKFENASL